MEKERNFSFPLSHEERNAREKGGKMKRIPLFLLILFTVISGYGENKFEGRSIWVHPRDMGKNESEVREFFALLKDCCINVVFPLVKDTGGAIFWHSEKFPDAVHPDYKDFDLLRAATRYARQYQIKIHPWLCDFTESKNSPAFNKHPEWAMLNPQGGNTSEEKLNQDQPYNPIWMCPVRRPGYVDQWLIPMIEEIVRNYEVDGIHHDYVRYPGDVAPDSYCFCDYCLEHYLVYNHFDYISRPDDQIVLKRVLPREEANWHYDLTLRPRNWSEMTREEKAAYLLNGSSINRNDLDYYFYETRVDAITRFVRESTEKARKINPNIEVSAAVFINPMRSARHIGQRWTDFASWIDIMAPMDYRSHFQGNFEDYLVYLEDYVRAQKKWCGGQSALYPGITGHYIYQEERASWEAAIDILSSENIDSQGDELKKLMTENIAYLRNFSAGRAEGLDARFHSYLENKIGKDILLDETRKVLSDPPPGFFPEDKLLRTIQTVKRAGADGVAIFAAGIIHRNKLWPALKKAFAQ
jgi:uncharacterized lipoprotein YddW (UPF0748 family)